MPYPMPDSTSSAPPAPAPDQGLEPDPIDDFIKLPQDQQLATLQAVSRENQDALLKKVAQRTAMAGFANTPTQTVKSPLVLSSTVPPEGVKGREGNIIQRTLDTATQPLSAGEKASLRPAERFTARVGQGAANALVAPISHPIATAEGLYQSMAPEMGTSPTGTPTVTPSAMGIAEGLLGPAAPIISHTLRGLYDQARTQGIPETLGNIGGGILGGEITGGILSKAGDIGKGILAKGARGTATKVIKDTVETNQKAIEAANAKNAAAQADAAKSAVAQEKAISGHEAAMEDYHRQVIAAQQEPTPALPGAPGTPTPTKQFTPAELASRQEAMGRGVEQLEPPIHEDLVQTEKNARDAANQQYNDLQNTPLPGSEAEESRPILNDEQTEPEFLGNTLQNAAEALKGSDSPIPPVMRDMQEKLGLDSKGNPKKLKKGEEPPEPEGVTFRDLQGYRSEIGTALSKGGLAGDVFHAYKGMMNDIDAAMQKMADKYGVGDKFQNARSSWRQYSDTFNDPTSPVRKALNNQGVGAVAGKTIRAFRDRDEAIAALAKYDPGLAQRINRVRKLQAEAERKVGRGAAPKVGAKPTAPGAAAPPPPKVEPQLVKAGPEDIQQARAMGLSGRAEKLVTSGDGYINAAAAFGGIKNILGFHLTGLAKDVAAWGLYKGGKIAKARFLSDPRAINWLSKPPVEDLEQLGRLPEDQRTVTNAELSDLIAEAKRRGLPVSPNLLAAVGVGTTAQRFVPQVETGSSTPTETKQFATTASKLPDTGDAASSLGVLPDALQRIIGHARIVQGGPAQDASGRPAIASVDDTQGNTIMVHNPTQMSPQVLAHEAWHLGRNNLNPAMQSVLTHNTPNLPQTEQYMQPEELYNLPMMRQKGMGFEDLPDELQAQVVGAYTQYYKDPKMRAILQPWMDEAGRLLQDQSNILPTPKNATQLVTTPRAPVPPMSAFAPR